MSHVTTKWQTPEGLVHIVKDFGNLAPVANRGDGNTAVGAKHIVLRCTVLTSGLFVALFHIALWPFQMFSTACQSYNLSN